MAKKQPTNKREEQSNDDKPWWQEYRQELTFLVVFAILLGGSFTVISLPSVNDQVIVPFTGLVAKASGVALTIIDSTIVRQGTIIRNEAFAVNIKNGCNGVETMLIFCAAVLAFPAPWKSRFVGLAFGLLAIQGVNLIRVVALFLTGQHFPDFFDTSHTVLWQTVVILAGVLLWIFWADRFAGSPAKVKSSGSDGGEAAPAS
ncbi:MAG: exosortase H [Acidobacteriota bacterium]